MPRAPSCVGKGRPMTIRRHLSPTKRLAIFERAHGRCHLCGQKIQVGEKWEVEHPIPLAIGGADDESNMAPAHVKCHTGKSADDAGNIARAKRREAKHLGAYRSANPMPGSKASKWKKPMNGPAVLR